MPHIVHLLDDPAHGRVLLASMQRAWRNREFRGDQRVSFLIGMMGYHPTEVSVRDDAVRDLTALLRSPCD